MRSTPVRLRYPGLVLWRRLVLWVPLQAGFGLACSEHSTGPAKVNPPALALEEAWAEKPLPSRLAVVQRAAALALRGEREGGASGAQLLLQAGRLRERVWRLVGRREDALEALELYREAGLQRWSGACTTQLALALLAAELHTDPSGGYREIFRIRASHTEPACRQRATGALTRLAAFKPQPGVLHQLQQQAGAPPRPAGSSNQPRVVLPPLAPKFATGPVRITSIEGYPAEDSARVVVFVTRPARFKTGYLAAAGAQGPRLYVDIHGAHYRGPATRPLGGVVRQLRVGQHGAHTRLVLDLRENVQRSVFYLPEPFRLLIDISKHAPQLQRAQHGPRRVRRVVLDPGHGGHDPGAIGALGLREKDVVLDIAHRTAPLIARELGITTLLTRDSDQFISLEERTARANAFGADLFVSIHCNAAEDHRSHGVMTFVLAASTDDLGLSIAARENSASPAAALELSTALSRLLDQETMNQSRGFAQLLQRASIAGLRPGYPGLRDRGVKSAGFYVLAGAQMPAVLYEASFISNSRDEERLNTGDYRQKLADAIVNAIRAYRRGL